MPGLWIFGRPYQRGSTVLRYEVFVGKGIYLFCIKWMFEVLVKYSRERRCRITFGWKVGG